MSEKGTEQATPQHKKKAKDRGDSVRSRELLSAVALLGGVLVLGAMTHGFVRGWSKVYIESLHSAAIGLDGDAQWSHAIRTMLAPALVPVGLVMAASFAGALFVGIAQGGGLSIHPNALELKFGRLNPVTNAGNLISLRSATRLVKSLVPAAAMVLFGWGALKALMLPMPVMSLMRLPATFGTAYGLAVDAAWVTLAWSGLDYAVEYISWNNRLKMSKQQMREEMKEAMGNPQVKGRIRQLQHAMRRRKVTGGYLESKCFDYESDALCGCPGVFVRDDDGSDGAGEGAGTYRRRRCAKRRCGLGIPMIENPPLARSLYRMVEPGQSIPVELYAAVAGILALFVPAEVGGEDAARASEAATERADQERQRRAAHRVPVTAGLRGFGGGI